jgi:hypothetical protein
MSMKHLFLIVEGHGDELALPILMHRLAAANGIGALKIAPPYRLHRGKIARCTEKFSNVLRHAEAVLNGDSGVAEKAIIVCIDADDECPLELKQHIDDFVNHCKITTPVHFVAFTLEYEAAFLVPGALGAIPGELKREPCYPSDPEKVRNAKGWLTRSILQAGAYSESVDQARLTRSLRIDQVTCLRSFRRLLSVLSA